MSPSGWTETMKHDLEICFFQDELERLDEEADLEHSHSYITVTLNLCVISVDRCNCPSVYAHTHTHTGVHRRYKRAEIACFKISPSSL